MYGVNVWETRIYLQSVKNGKERERESSKLVIADSFLHASFQLYKISNISLTFVFTKWIEIKKYIQGQYKSFYYHDRISIETLVLSICNICKIGIIRRNAFNLQLHEYQTIYLIVSDPIIDHCYVYSALASSTTRSVRLCLVTVCLYVTRLIDSIESPFLYRLRRFLFISSMCFNL